MLTLAGPETAKLRGGREPQSLSVGRVEGFPVEVMVIKS